MWGKINLYKPQDMTSQQAVSRLRRILGIKKIGHSGTLDPMAQGVLNCYVGRATRFIDLLAEEEKVYRADFVLGQTSDTLDIWGRVEQLDFFQPSRAQVEQVITGFLGESYQLPPMYSAIKYQGRPLYHYARAGQDIPRKKREIFISKINLLDFDGTRGSLEIKCSRGTYIRTLISDIGEKLATGAIMSGLIRQHNDWARLEDCFKLEEIEEMFRKKDHTFLLSVDNNVVLPRFDLGDSEYKLLAQGRIKSIEASCQAGRYLLYSREKFVGTGLCEDGFLQRERVVQVDYGS